MTELKLRESQEEIINDQYGNDLRYVVAGMGSGKTSATLHALSELHDADVIDCAVVLAPPLVAATVWPKEPAKWPALRHAVSVRAPSLQDRAQALQWLAEGGGTPLRVVSLSFHLCKWLKENADQIPERCALVIDEGSFFGGPRSKNGAALREIAGRFTNRYILSGTPRAGGYEELWGQYTILAPGIWPAFDDWRRKNFMPKDYNGYEWEVHDFRARQLDRQVAALTTVIDVDLGLPPLSAGPDFDYMIDLPPDARAAYDEMEEEQITAVAKQLEAMGDVPEEVLVAALTRAVASGKLAQIAQGYIYSTPEGEDTGRKVADLHTAKQDMLTDILHGCRGENLLIWYGYRADIELIEKAVGAKNPLPRLGGGVTPSQARKAIEAFGRGELPFLLAHPASAAHGIDDLKHHCHRMIWFCPTWSAEQYDQALKRLDRPGQTKPVFSHQIAARATVDEVKLNRVAYKLDDQAEWRRLVKALRSKI
jgi:hypothetical protein